MTGLRRGEVLALRWQNTDLEGSQFSVVQSLEQTKAGLRFKETKNSKTRHIDMPSLLRDELRRHRLKQAEGFLKLGERQTDEHLVVCREDGEPMNPEHLSREFPNAVISPGLPRISFHTLRHSHATLMLISNVHPKVAQERLGHSSISITLDLYSRLVPSLQKEAAEKVDIALRYAMESTNS